MKKLFAYFKKNIWNVFIVGIILALVMSGVLIGGTLFQKPTPDPEIEATYVFDKCVILGSYTVNDTIQGDRYTLWRVKRLSDGVKINQRLPWTELYVVGDTILLDFDERYYSKE